jgi:hypothetical protein
MAGMIFDLEICYEGRDDVEEVRADQRDMAAFELAYRMGTTTALEQRTVTFLRWIGWHAMRRTGRTEAKFEDWERDVTSVSEPEPPAPPVRAGDDEDQEDAADLGPTNPAQ